MGMTVSGQQGDSVFLRGWDDYETCSLQLTASHTSGLGHAAFRTRSAAAAVGAESCQLTLYDEETAELIARRPRYDAPGQRVPQYRFRLDTSPASVLVLRTGQPYLSNDPASDPLYDPSIKERGVRSVLTVPVRRGPRILGFLYAINKPGGFTDEDVRTLCALAGAGI